MIKNILLVGNGAREHAIARAIKKSPQKPRLHCFMKARNPGIIQISESVFVGDLTDSKEIVDFAQKVNVDCAVIGPEAPLAAGVVDALLDVGIPSIGPQKELAQLETSKSFTRNLLNKYNIKGNPQYKVFTSTQGIKEFIELLDGNYVVKADGLHGGKGVKLSHEHLKTIDEGIAYCKQCIETDGSVVVEEKFVGQEFSLMSFVDGKNVLDMIPVQDHKRAFEDDCGPNTGGMGSYSDQEHLLPFIKKKDLEEAHTITQNVCNALFKETGKEYKGIMYGGFIATKNGVRLIEYNARFGDPEAMNVLPLLKTDFAKICEHIISGTLDELPIEFKKKASVCKYVVPKGYPTAPVRDKKIIVPKNKEARTYYAAIDQRSDGLYMTGSRAVALVGIAQTIEEAEKIAQSAAEKIEGEVFFRKDIGTKELIQKRISHMNTIRENNEI